MLCLVVFPNLLEIVGVGRVEGRGGVKGFVELGSVGRSVRSAECDEGDGGA